MEKFTAILEKARSLLLGNPARAIGYGAAVVIWLVVRLANELGVQFGELSFEASVAAAFAAITVLVTVIEGIRKFVYSPQTYIEDLADEWQAGHDAAHFEQMVIERMESMLANERPAVVPIGVMPPVKPGQEN